MPLLTLRRITITGKQCWAYWRKADSTIVKTSLTAAQYAALALPGAKAPPGSPDVGAVWVGAIEQPLWSTTSGYPEVGDIWLKYAGRIDIQRLAGPPRLARITLDLSVVVTTGNLNRLTVVSGLPDGWSLVNGVLSWP